MSSLPSPDELHNMFLHDKVHKKAHVTLILGRCQEKHLTPDDKPYLNKVSLALHSVHTPISNVIVILESNVIGTGNALYYPLQESLRRWSYDNLHTEIQYVYNEEDVPTIGEDEEVIFIWGVESIVSTYGANSRVLNFEEMGVSEGCLSNDEVANLTQTQELVGSDYHTKGVDIFAEGVGQIMRPAFRDDPPMVLDQCVVHAQERGVADPTCRHHVNERILEGRISHATPLGYWGPGPKESPILIPCGLRGLGRMYRWGANQMGHMLLYAMDGDGGVHVLLCRQQHSKGLFGIPGGFIKPGETAANASLLGLLHKKTLTMKCRQKYFDGAVVLSRSFVPDSRNTMDAWIETTCFIKQMKDVGELESEVQEMDGRKGMGYAIMATLSMDMKNPAFFSGHLQFLTRLLTQVQTKA